MSKLMVKSSLRVERLLAPGLLLLLVFALSVLSAQAQEPYTLEPVTAKADAYLPQSLVDGLNPEGVKVLTISNGLPAVVCELWWTKSIQTYKPGAEHVLYGGLQTGELLGVIHFLAETSEDYREDFRDQKLRPGYYTMRYAIMPHDDAHKDVNPYRDFVLLSPVSVDRDPAKVLSADQLLRNSRFASRSKHPAIMSLVPGDPSRKARMAVRTDDTGGCILQAHLHTDSQQAKSDFPIGIILVTPSKENGAS